MHQALRVPQDLCKIDTQSLKIGNESIKKNYNFYLFFILSILKQ